MATRELAEIKDKNGDVNELRDKKLADSIAKNTVVNTDNVRMVDTNGKEVFIARDSFISAIRNVLGGFILSNTKAEAPNIPVFDSNGDFGAITAANLASVLGVQGHSETIVRLGFNLWLVSSFYIGNFGLKIKTKNPCIIIEAHIYNYSSVTKIEIYASNSANSCKVVETDLSHNYTPSFSLWATANRDSDGYFIFWANLYNHWFGSFFIHLLDNTGESEVTAGSADRQDSGSIKVYQQ